MAVGCGGAFEHDDGPDGLCSPLHCPLCGATFCGEDCCGNYAEEEVLYYWRPGLDEADPASEILALYPDARDVRSDGGWTFRAFPTYPQDPRATQAWEQ